MEKLHKFESEIIELKKINNSLRHMELSVPKDFLFLPGQFVLIIIEKDKNKIRRPYSIASSNNKKRSIDIIYKLIPDGLMTPMLENLKVGDKLELLGPAGNFIISDKTKNLVFISTGTGVAPFISMISSLLESNFKNKIALFAGYRNEEDIINSNKFKELKEKHSNFKYYEILSQPQQNYSGERGRVQVLIEKYVKNINNTDFYICGLKDMVNSVRALLNRNGVEMKNIYSEKYD